MPKLTICTFNVENLFGRYKVFGYMPGDKFKRKILDEEELKEKGGFHPGEFAPRDSFHMFDKDEWRTLTARALRGKTADYPDIACLQEVEDMRVLRRFNRDFLKKKYPYTLLIDSHDPRLIDIGILSKHRITGVKTHVDEPYSDRSGYLFSRDCLEVTFDADGEPLTLFVNHLKSKYTSGDNDKERERGDKKRLAQAQRVAEIVSERFPGGAFSNAAFAVVGDLNDTPGSEFLEPLVKGLGLENVVKRLPKEERWTHLLKSENHASQIDYILLSPRLANDSNGRPYIERRGLTASKKKTRLTDDYGNEGDFIEIDPDRFDNIGKKEASDHCPVFFEISL